MDRERITRLISFDDNDDTSTGYVYVNDIGKLPFDEWLETYRNPMAKVRVERTNDPSEIIVYIKPYKHPDFGDSWEYSVEVFGNGEYVDGGYFEDFEHECDVWCDDVDGRIAEVIEEYGVNDNKQACEEIRKWFDMLVDVYKDIPQKYRMYNPSLEGL